MKASTEWMVRIAAVVLTLWAGWSLVSSTVIHMVNQNFQVQGLTKELVACRGGQSKISP